MEEVFLVSGKFKVYDNRGIFRTSNFYLNEHFQASFAALAKRMGILEVQKRVTRKYGSGARVKVMEINVEPVPVYKLTEKSIRKEKRTNKKRQGKLF